MPFRDDRDALRARLQDLEHEVNALRDAKERNRVLEERTLELEDQLAGAREREQALTNAVLAPPAAVPDHAAITPRDRKRSLRILAALLVLLTFTLWIASLLGRRW